MILKSHTATTQFGSLHYMAPSQRASRDVVLFIHGFDSSWATWKAFIAVMDEHNLMPGLDRVCVDLPSFGRSTNVLPHLNSAPLGDDLISLMRQLGYERIHLVGHSMGGFLAMDMASRRADVVASVHVIAGTYFRLIETANHPVKAVVKAPLVATFYWYQRLISRNAANRRAFSYASQNGVGYNARQRWGGISMPVYAVFGGRDPLVSRRDMRLLARILPHAHLTLLPGLGHMALVRRPTRTAVALFDVSA